MGVLVFLPTKYSSTQAPTCCACSSASSLLRQRFQAGTSSPLSPTVSSTVKTWQTPQSPRGRCPSSRPEVTSAADLSLEATTSCPLATATSDLPLSFWEPSIAILYMETPVLEDDDIKYIDVADKEYPAGTPAQITGWGKMGAISNIPKIMQVAETVLMKQNECASIWGSNIDITSRMQCAGGLGINSGCQGDSGGPL